jgi:hypothetical protein
MLNSLYQDIDYSQGITELELLKYGSKPWNYEHEFSYRRLSATEWLIAATPNPIYNPDHEFNRTMIGLALKIVLLVIGVLIVLMSSMTIWYSFRSACRSSIRLNGSSTFQKGDLKSREIGKAARKAGTKKGKRKQP